MGAGFVSVKKGSDPLLGGPMVMCKGSSFPKTEQSDKNIEVLTAWRSITSDPQFKVCFLSPLFNSYRVGY